MADPLDGIAEIDFGRGARRGYPEAVLCASKTPEQVGLIAERYRDWYAESGSDQPTLFTRCSPEHLDAITAVLPDAAVDRTARLAAWPPLPPEPTGDKVLVVCAGTSDLPVAREALLTSRYLGRETDLVVDVGVAGLHRILNRREQLDAAGVVVVCAGTSDLPVAREALLTSRYLGRETDLVVDVGVAGLHRILNRRGQLNAAGVVIVCAGMEGALASVVAGLVSCPVVAVPTSVGYGASFEGLAALLSMMNACAPGVGVVNIDNGYGAGHLAAQIAAPRRTAQ